MPSTQETCGPQNSRSITIGIVHLNSGDGLSRLHSQIETERELISWQISNILIDHGSNDQSQDIVTKIEDSKTWHVIRDPANNLGKSRSAVLENTKSEWLLYLDSDIELQENDLQIITDHITKIEGDEKIAGFCGVMKLSFENEKLRPLESLQNTFWGSGGSLQLHQPSQPRSVSHLPGGVAVYRKKALLAVGGFSKEHPRCGEDLEIGLRLNEAGYSLEQIPWWQAVHRSSLPSYLAWLQRSFRFGQARGELLGRYKKRALEPLVYFGFAVLGLDILILVWKPVFLLSFWWMQLGFMACHLYIQGHKLGPSVKASVLAFFSQRSYGAGLVTGVIKK